MKTLDVRPYACSQRHTMIFSTFDGLAVGEGFAFINDHDPKPLYYQLCQRYPDQLTWGYLEQGPEVWRVAVHRVAVEDALQFEADSSLSVHIQTANPTQEQLTMKTVDVRNMIPRDRHPLIFQTFDGLTVGASFELVNDHDPKPLYYQFLHERPGQFDWEYLEQGPEVWRVTISRKQS